MQLMLKRAHLPVLMALMLALLAGASQGQGAWGQSFADPAFQATWERTDKPVADGSVKRSFYWGPAPLRQQTEPYAEGAGGKRPVQYFDKSRMEINNPAGDKSSPFYVTNGLLTVELISGRVQVGNAAYTDLYPAQIPLASDSDDTQAPTYATFGKLLGKASSRLRQTPTERIDKEGNIISTEGVRVEADLTVVYYEPATGHNIPKVFWDFLNATGPVWVGGKLTDARLSDPWFYAPGLPISEPYWAKVKINGQSGVDVFVQAYERRVLTYVPSLPKDFQVQMGNIGLHYYDWRYNGAGKGSEGTPVPQPSGKLSITGTVKTPLSLTMADLKSRAAQSVSVTFTTSGGGTESHNYKGPLLLDLLKEAGGEGNAGRDLLVRYIVATSAGGQKAVLSWGEIDPIFAGRKVVVAYEQDGADLQGGQIRLVIPSDKAGGRSLLGLSQLEVKTIPPNQPTGNTLRITGAVQKTLGLTAADLPSRNPVSVQVTYMAGGQTETHQYKGVPLVTLLNEAGANTADPNAMLTRYIVAAGNDGRQSIISWGEIDPAYSGVNVLVAYEENGVPLGGGLTRLVVPSDARGGRYVPYLLSLDVRDK
jgi:DMSO/TMAO reductase YedYZ molybdopterin-dependent catalytic subunit